MQTYNVNSIGRAGTMPLSHLLLTSSINHPFTSKKTAVKLSNYLCNSCPSLNISFHARRQSLAGRIRLPHGNSGRNCVLLGDSSLLRVAFIGSVNVELVVWFWEAQGSPMMCLEWLASQSFKSPIDHWLRVDVKDSNIECNWPWFTTIIETLVSFFFILNWRSWCVSFMLKGRRTSFHFMFHFRERKQI